MVEPDDGTMTFAVDPGSAALSRGHGVAVWRQIADALGGEIESGRFRAGAQVPTEAALSERFGVNRHTVRRALASLAARGLVRATRGSGTFVAGPLTYPIGARTRFSEILARAGREAVGELVVAREVAADPVNAGLLDVVEGARLTELITLHLADGVPLSTAETLLPLPRFAGFAAAYAASGSITQAHTRFGTADYRRRSTRITARAASGAEAARLDLGPGGIVLAVDSVNIDRDGRPIQATHALFAAERVEFLVES